jgi:YbgC/YbaW family acyl-CoA thioester hydrolase
MKEYRMDFQVRWGDVDKAGVIYYPNLFHYFEVGIEELMLSTGSSYQEIEKKYKIGFPRVAVSAEFISPIKFGDLLRLRVKVERIGKKSITFRLEVRKDKMVVAKGNITAVAIDTESWKPVTLPDGLVKILK